MAERADISAVARVIDQASGPIRAIQGVITQAGQAAKNASASLLRLGSIGPINAIQGALGRAAQAARSATASFLRLGTVGAFGGLAQNLRNVGAAAGRLGGQLKSLVTGAAGLIGIAGVASIGGVVAAMKSYISTTAQLAGASRRLGVSAEQLQVFRYAAGNAEAADDALGKLQRTMVLVTAGGKKAGKGASDTAALFRKLGVTQVEMRAGNMAAILPKIAEGFSKTTSQQTRAKMGMALFGKSWAQIEPLLSKGNAGLAEAAAKLQELGYISNAETAAGAAAAKAWKEMNAAVGGLKNTLAAELLPLFEPIIKGITGWITANRTWLKEQLNTAVTELVVLLKQLGESLKSTDWSGFGRGLRNFGGAVLWVVNALGGWRNALIGLVLLMNAKLIGSLLAVGVALGKLVLSAVALNPLTLAVAALAGGALLLYRNWDQVAPWFKRSLETLKAPFANLGTWARESIAQVKAAYQQGGITAATETAVDRLKTKFLSISDAVQEVWKSIPWATIGTQAAGLMRDAWKATLVLGTWLREQFEAIRWDAVGTAIGNALIAAAKAAVNLVEWLLSLNWEGTGQSIGNALGSALLATLKTMTNILEWLETLDWEATGRKAGELIAQALVALFTVKFDAESGQITNAFITYFDTLIRSMGTIGTELIKGLIKGMIDGIPGLRDVTEKIGAAFRLPGKVHERLFGPSEAQGPQLAEGQQPGESLFSARARAGRERAAAAVAEAAAAVAPAAAVVAPAAAVVAPTVAAAAPTVATAPTTVTAAVAAAKPAVAAAQPAVAAAAPAMAATVPSMAAARPVVPPDVAQGAERIKQSWAGLDAWFVKLWAGVQTSFTKARDSIRETIAGLVPKPLTDAWGTLSGFFDDMWTAVIGIFQRAHDAILGIVEAIAAAVQSLTGVVQGVQGAAMVPMGETPRLFDGAPATAPAPVATSPRLIQQQAAATQATPQRSEIEQRLKVDLSPDLRATLQSERTRGAPVTTQVDIGRSMEPAWGAA